MQALKRQILPNEKVILFGSQARGDARPDSDWDLLVLLNKEKRSFIEDYDQYGYPFSEIGDKYGTFISVIIHTKNDWETHPSLLKYNIEREGIEII
ncbi:MAG: nucleotidyltransferase domain-containing protein [Tannerella sp.]|nr:nucleotidyltransferase domain-containing protein [Tannerella sp.]